MPHDPRDPRLLRRQMAHLFGCLMVYNVLFFIILIVIIKSCTQ